MLHNHDEHQLYQQDMLTSLQKLHSQQLLNDHSNAHNTSAIVDVLGGIDSILDDYLSETNNMYLSEHHVTKITQIIRTPHIFKHQKTNPLTKLTSNSQIDENDIGSEYLCYLFHESNTWLHSLFTNDIANQINCIIHHNKFYCFVILVAVVYAVIFVLYGLSSAFYICQLILLCFAIPTILCWILTANKKASKLVFYSFEFWFKIIYAISIGVLACIETVSRFNGDESILKLIAVSINAFVGIPLAVTWISLFDGLKVSKFWKVLPAVAVAIMCSLIALYGQFFIPDKDDLVIQITPVHTLSIMSTIANLMRTLSIFIWKQAILSCIRDEKCVSIKYTPYMKWIPEDVGNRSNVVTAAELSLRNSNAKEDDIVVGEMHITETNLIDCENDSVSVPNSDCNDSDIEKP